MKKVDRMWIEPVPSDEINKREVRLDHIEHEIATALDKLDEIVDRINEIDSGLKDI